MKGGLATALMLVAALFPVHALHAQTTRLLGPMPQDCLSLLDRSGISGLADWQSTVALEHCDRVKRLQRLSELLPSDERPLFFESVIPQDRLPRQYKVDIPVLRVVFPDRVFFDTAKSTLRPEAMEIVRIVSQSLRREPPDVTLFVAGHADSRGDADYNELLSINRADALAAAIFREGINLGTVWRIGFGEDMPLEAGQSESAWGQNRRIEFLFAAKPEPIGVWLADQQLPGLCQSRNAMESERCRAGLQLRTGYEAARIENLDSGARRQVSPVRQRRSVAMQPGTRGAAPTGSQRSDKSQIGQTRDQTMPEKPERMVVVPSNTPRLVINPVNRQAEPVRVRF